MYEIRLVSTGAVVTRVPTLSEAQQWMIVNWSGGPYVVVQTINEEIVSEPKLLNE